MKHFFKLLLLNTGIVSLLMYFLNSITSLNFDLVLNQEWLFSIAIIALTIAFTLKEKSNKLTKEIYEIAPPFFLSILAILTINQFLNLEFLTIRNTPLTVMAIALGFLAFHKNRNKVEQELENEKQLEEKAEEKRAREFEWKFPRINKIPILKNVLKWMYGQRWSFSIPLVIITIIFIGIKIGMPLFYNGSYLDEYFHIFSGINFLNEGEFAQFYKNQETYSRGFYVSLIVGAFMAVFGKTILVAKIVPAIVGILNFILVFKIGEKMLKKKQSVLLLLSTYALIFTTTFNHFYVRMFFIHETFFLGLVLIIIKLNKKIEEEKYLFVTLSIVAMVMLNVILRVFYGGTDTNFFNFLTIIFLVVLIIVNKDKIKFDGKSLIISSLIALMLIGTFFSQIKAIIVDVLNPYGNYLNSIGYWHYFFERPLLIFSILFVIAMLSPRNKVEKIVIYSTGLIFLAHLFSPQELQLIRGILYFMPLFLLTSFNVIEKMKINGMTIMTAAIIVGTIVSSYPPGFFENPYLEREINFMDNNALEHATTLCKNAMVITSSRPWIFELYDLQTDYYVNTKYSDGRWLTENDESLFGEYNQAKRSYVEIYSNTPIISNVEDLKKKIEGENICFIQGGLPYDWLNEEAREIIKKEFKQVKEYKSNLDYNRITIYKK